MSPPERGIRSRPATQDDLTILWDFLAITAYEPDAEAAKAVPFVAAHLAGWQRSEDFGFIAEFDGGPIGAAWARQFAPGEEPAFFVDERTPEITIGVRPHIRGRGVGRALLHALLAEATRRDIGLCLNGLAMISAPAPFRERYAPPLLKVGHYGVFRGRRWQAETYPKVVLPLQKIEDI